MAFHDAATPDDLPPSHQGEPVAVHWHQCPCGLAAWTCCRLDCAPDDLCQSCDDNALTAWLDARQPVLEPVEALLGHQEDQ